VLTTRRRAASIRMMNLDGLFMDMYGTLTGGDRAAVEDTCRAVIEDHGLALTARQLSITWGDAFFHALEQANGARFETLAELERRTLRETMARLGFHVDPDPYVRRLVAYWRDPPLQAEVLAFLAACPVPICVVSNADRDDLGAALGRHGIDVHAIVTSEDARSYKPDTAIFELALQQTGWNPDRVLHVGDSLHSDVGGAQAAGLRSVWLNRVHRIHDVGEATPDYEFTDLRGLAALLRNGDDAATTP
jgi:2-haloalkanoic acid dehalogenase type II